MFSLQLVLLSVKQPMANKYIWLSKSGPFSRELRKCAVFIRLCLSSSSVILYCQGWIMKKLWSVYQRVARCSFGTSWKVNFTPQNAFSAFGLRGVLKPVMHRQMPLTVKIHNKKDTTTKQTPFKTRHLYLLLRPSIIFLRRKGVQVYLAKLGLFTA